MKDCDETELREVKPKVTPTEAVEFCLKALISDRSKSIADNVCSHLTYEELIGALLLADESIKAFHSDMESMQDKISEAAELLADARDAYIYG